jgi:hypothetical protein
MELSFYKYNADDVRMPKLSSAFAEPWHAEPTFKNTYVGRK